MSEMQRQSDLSSSNKEQGATQEGEMQDDIQKSDLIDQIEQAVKSESLPNIYFNGFITSIGSGDILVILKRHNKPVAVLNTSYTVAKTLATKLGGAIENLEKKTGTIIMTTEDVTIKLGE